MIRALPPFPPGAADGAAPPRARRCGDRGGLRAPSPPGLSVCAPWCGPSAGGGPGALRGPGTRRDPPGAPLPLARPPPPLPGRPGRRSPSFWAALLLVPVWDPLSCVIPRWRGEPVPGNCARLLLAPLERVWERRCLGAAVSFWPPLLPRVPNTAVSPVTRPVGLPPVAHSPVGCLPKCLRGREPRSVPRAPKRGDSNKKDKKLSGSPSVFPDRVP